MQTNGINNSPAFGAKVVFDKNLGQEFIGQAAGFVKAAEDLVAPADTFISVRQNIEPANKLLNGGKEKLMEGALVSLEKVKKLFGKSADISPNVVAVKGSSDEELLAAANKAIADATAPKKAKSIYG